MKKKSHPKKSEILKISPVSLRTSYFLLLHSAFLILTSDFLPLTYPLPAVYRISKSRSSSDAALFRRSWPHFRHRWITMNPFFGSGSVRMGSRIPPQSAARSPGFTSTWRDERQNGQWFREVYPSGGTSLPQAAQTNPLSFFVNRLVSIVFLPFSDGL